MTATTSARKSSPAVKAEDTGSATAFGAFLSAYSDARTAAASADAAHARLCLSVAADMSSGVKADALAAAFALKAEGLKGLPSGVIYKSNASVTYLQRTGLVLRLPAGESGAVSSRTVLSAVRKAAETGKGATAKITAAIARATDQDAAVKALRKISDDHKTANKDDDAAVAAAPTIADAAAALAALVKAAAATGEALADADAAALADVAALLAAAA